MRAVDDGAWHRTDHFERDVAAIGNGAAFSRGATCMPYWCPGIDGNCIILGKISKQGNRDLRVLFVQAARVVRGKPTMWERHGLKSWIEAAKKRLHHNVLAIALANKLARIAWAVLNKERNFECARANGMASQAV